MRARVRGCEGAARLHVHVHEHVHVQGGGARARRPEGGSFDYSLTEMSERCTAHLRAHPSTHQNGHALLTPLALALIPPLGNSRTSVIAVVLASSILFLVATSCSFIIHHPQPLHHQNPAHHYLSSPRRPPYPSPTALGQQHPGARHPRDPAPANTPSPHTPTPSPTRLDGFLRIKTVTRAFWPA